MRPWLLQVSSKGSEEQKMMVADLQQKLKKSQDEVQRHMLEAQIRCLAAVGSYPVTHLTPQGVCRGEGSADTWCGKAGLPALTLQAY